VRTALGGVIAAAAAAVVLRWARRTFVVVKVSGFSMAPTFAPGDRVLVRRCHPQAVRTGRVVVVVQPDRQLGWVDAVGPLGERTWNIKRVVAVAGEPVPSAVRDAPAVDGRTAVPAGALVVLGDNPESADSKQYGFCPANALLGVAVRRIQPQG
jgi:signal peptidase I